MPAEGHRSYSKTLLFPALQLRAVEPKGEERGHTQLAAGRSLAGHGLDMGTSWWVRLIGYLQSFCGKFWSFQKNLLCLVSMSDLDLSGSSWSQQELSWWDRDADSDNLFVLRLSEGSVCIISRTTFCMSRSPS